jgi:hypothetical protein
MATFYLVCALLGGAVLVIQLGLGFLGIVEHHDLSAGISEHGDSEGLDLLSVRALSAGLAFLGIGGMFGMWLGLGAFLSAPIALLTGGATTIGVAATMRAMRRLEADHSVLVEEAIGERGTVYLNIPARQSGQGKVHVPLRGRLAELPAVTLHEELPTGASVVVMDVIDGETLVVAADSFTAEVSDAAR